MSHEDFAQYVDEGMTISGHTVSLTTGPDAEPRVRINQANETPLAFDTDEGFESRVEKVAAAVKACTGGSAA